MIFFGWALFPALQGHAIKNQDLLVASGAVQPAIGGSEAMTELYEDVKIAVSSLIIIKHEAVLVAFPTF